MRKTFEYQMQFGEINIADIEIDQRSRDDIPKILKGLQHIYCTPQLREEIFTILNRLVPEGVSTKNGRPGMNLWRIFVFGTLRLCCNWDYDRLHEMANNHQTLRQMLGHGIKDEKLTGRCDSYVLETNVHYEFAMGFYT